MIFVVRHAHTTVRDLPTSAARRCDDMQEHNRMQNRTQNRHLLEKTPTRGCREMRTIPYVYAGVYEDGAASSGQAGSEVVVWSGALIGAVKAHSCVVLGL